MGKETHSVPRIEILGVFGSGKTTLSVHLSNKVGALLPERHELNPLWGKQSSIENLGYLPYDLYFLLQHADLASSKIAVSPQAVSICDWSFRTDRLWASMRLGDDIQVYDAVYGSILKHISPPLGYLYLPQPVNKIIERIGSRGRASEASFVKHVSAAAKNLGELVESMTSENVLEVSDFYDSDYVLQKIHAWLRDSRVKVHE